MEIAPAFKKVVRQLNMSEMPQPFSEEGWIRGVVGGLDPVLRQSASGFVAHVLESEVPPSELRSLLEEAGSEYDINDRGILEFFKMLKRVL